MTLFPDTLLRALARLMVQRGILFPDLADRIKAQYVAVAEEDGGKVTDSRISVLTGLQRRDIARLRNAPKAKPRENHLAKIVAVWLAQHQGRDLDRAEFDAMAQELRKDIHPRTSLDALAEAGTIAIDGAVVRLIEHAYRPLPGSDEQLDYLAQNVADHLDVAGANVSGAASGFERAVYYDQLTDADIETLKDRHAVLQMAVLEELNALAADLKSQRTGRRRFRAGAYFYQSDKDRT